MADRLREGLFASGKDVWIFVDPLVRDPFNRLELAQRLSPPTVQTIALHRRGIHPDQCPYIIKLSRSLDSLLEESLELALTQAGQADEPRSLCGWFTTELQGKALERALHAEMERQTQQGERWLVRFYDPRCLQHWPRIFGNQLALFGVDDWWYIDAEDSFAVVSSRKTLERNEISSRQEAQIHRIGLLNQALQVAGENLPLAADAIVSLDQAIELAHRLGLRPESNDVDILAFALHRFLVHPQIEQHPDVMAWLEDAKAEPGAYAASAAQLQTEAWSQLAAGDWLKKLQGGRHG
jgi:hypothetical protein